MKRSYFLQLAGLLIVLLPIGLKAQNSNALSIYEGERIHAVYFTFKDLPSDTLSAINVKQKVENTFKIYPYTHYSEFQTEYYLAQIRRFPFVETAILDVTMPGEGGVQLTITVTLTTRKEMTKNTFPVIYMDKRSYLTLRFAASEMAYSNNNAWFGQPTALLTNNPLADAPVGKGYTGWLEGFVMGGAYGITKIIPRMNLHLYGGASYIASFSAGRELFTDRSRFYGAVEDAFVGLVGGKRSLNGHNFSYNVLYGRKQFVLGNGWLIVNTSMNGQKRAGLQINPRWAAKNLFQAGITWDKLLLQAFQMRPNELPIFNSHTIINGLNLELGTNSQIQPAISVLHSPRSDVRYYLPDGSSHTRNGLWVYNLRFFGNQPANRPGLFYKTEVGYQTNPHFKMRAYAGYAQAGWNFTRTPGAPAVSYRFAYFSGDNPATVAYERWDALYTGGNGEQWVQGSNMYKIVQNSNEMSHLVQLVYSPFPKIQTVTQIWAFLAPQTNNLGGNPALSVLQSNYYGTELNLTVKYFHSRRWYFHLNTALTFPGEAIRDIVPDTKSWFCLMAFARYSL
ncbi:MAG: alginate export family protein [Tannerellaceae bacterium]